MGLEAPALATLSARHSFQATTIFPPLRAIKMVSSTSASASMEGKQQGQEHPRHNSHHQPQQSSHVFPARPSSSATPARTYSGDRNSRKDSTAEDGGGTGSSYRLPQYLHDTLWPRPRPSAEAAAKARAARRARAERGVISAADARVELEEKVRVPPCNISGLAESCCW